ncbi:hypothetical protein [Mycobacteroides franklinii]|uniref:Uncharacterized protein n=1 Tax=Mycobacteroides franklinii TaxID=948102 RepID=A0A4R8R836_9MYCO|nr:hypothetical protein [Mycobacteroides franklinii]TDZ42288.1 hypothetical protein CCUG64054_02332 [Mycobacteroides franklinii]TDZ52436.1 hypothetical protein CCUG63697_00917 [Mycobacteroides franklinii]TDZ55843.1 hypothetical protein CCUG63696_02334 [Mycobacteroides franklinii]TDZ62784.1 hypothetical protein CCUG63695_02259 [Mycobacteroides franklinii]TDZ69181.1 hypothetical protein CCUG64056_02332 [Mycobacteroides franklinii]
MRRLRILLAFLAVVGLSLTISAPANAYAPVNVVHTEQVVAGPYALTVGFSTWPLRAMQSLDFTFIPSDGIAGKSGTLTVVPPDGRTWPTEPLARHPRKREVWGLDIKALQEEGHFQFVFDIDGQRGPGKGTLNLDVLSQPGPPLALSWTISLIPLFALVGVLIVAWRRTRDQT